MVGIADFEFIDVVNDENSKNVDMSLSTNDVYSYSEDRLSMGNEQIR